MGSGNFLIGVDLSYEGFDEYIKPYLDSKNVVVTDRMMINNPHATHEKTLLMAISGRGILEEIINDAMVGCYKKVDSDMKNSPSPFSTGPNKPKAYTFQIANTQYYRDKDNKQQSKEVGRFEVLGTYNDDATASKLFSLIAQKFLSQEVSAEIDDLSEKFEDLGKKLIGK